MNCMSGLNRILFIQTKKTMTLTRATGSVQLMSSMFYTLCSGRMRLDLCSSCSHPYRTQGTIQITHLPTLVKFLASGGFTDHHHGARRRLARHRHQVHQDPTVSAEHPRQVMNLREGRWPFFQPATS